MQRGFMLDTNVLSELIRAKPDVQVLAWFADKQQAQLYTSSITQAEMLLGVALLPLGKRREALAQAVMNMFDEDFSGNCMPFDHRAAQEYALLVASRQADGMPISTEDAQIAAIAMCNACVLVTRNTKDFSNIKGLALINPWLSVS